jgi:flagellin
LDQTNAVAAMAQIDLSLKEVNTETIKHGAHQNRFQAVIATLQVSVENQTTSRSRIMDTDYAAETATMARGQILQQAGMAMLAQANQLPNGVMALMKG